MSHSDDSTNSSVISKIVQYHDLIPLFFFALMVLGLVIYFDPSSHSVAEWRMILGKKLLVPYANLGLLVYIILLKTLPFLSEHLKERNKLIADGVCDFEKRNDNIVLQYKQTKEKLANVTKETEEIIARAVSLAKEDKLKSIEQSKLIAERIKRDAEKVIKQELQHIKNDMQRGLLHKTFTEANELINSHLDDNDQVRFREEFLQSVGEDRQ